MAWRSSRARLRSWRRAPLSQWGHLASSGIHKIGQAELLAINLRDFGHEIDGVNWCFVGVVKEPDNVKRPFSCRMATTDSKAACPV
jgi:hypothetical protein